MAHSEKTFHGSEKRFHSGNTFTVEKSNNDFNDFQPPIEFRISRVDIHEN